MSYSFSVKAATKADAKAQVAAELDKVVAAQPTHKVDRDAVGVVTDAFIDAVAEPSESEEITVMVSGSVSWRGVAGQDNNEFTGAEVTTRVYVRAKSL